MFTQQETVTHCLLVFILQPIHLNNLSPHTPSQPIISRIQYQQLLCSRLLPNQIAHQGF